MSSSASRRPSSAHDPYGILPGGSPIAPLLAAVGLVLVAVLTVSLFNGRLTALLLPGRHSGGGAAGETPAPPNVVITNPSVSVTGSLVYVKAGNLWVQSGTKTHQLTVTGRDSMPAWSPDRRWIYFIETRITNGSFPNVDGVADYRLTYPVLERIHPDGSGRQDILSGLYHAGAGGAYTWFSWYRQPAVSPDGSKLALVSDAPDPTQQDVILQFLDLATKKLSVAPVAENTPLGHQDPAWRPDGKAVAFVMNAHDGAKGTPAIYVYTLATREAAALSGAGYMNPAWSPDGRYLAATKTSLIGTDVVILDARSGKELIQVTSDGRSWSPTWSPAGDELVYMHLAGQIVDLKLVKLDGTAPAWTIKEQPDLTERSGLDGSSKAAWSIPAGQLPGPTPSATPTVGGSGSPKAPATSAAPS
ncbi:MAG: hypothetical protein ACXWMU_05645 [Candidatus Limnocylindrales bacterium]